VQVSSIRPGLWRWTAPHPDWTPKDGGPGGWEQDVGCLYFEAPDAVVLFDPLAPPDGTPDAERFWRTLDGDVARLDRPVAVLLTAHWHERSAQAVYDRYRERPGVSLWLPEGSRTQAEVTPTDTVDQDAPLPGDVLAYGSGGPGAEEYLFYVPAHRALVAGDVLVGEGDGRLRLGWVDGDPEWKRDKLLPSLRPLLDLPIEMVLVSHGEPTLEGGREALARALEEPAWGR
jgi:glyoxylase-like metal-dependent hydrolase (beta-lactamase superfamily II)